MKYVGTVRIPQEPDEPLVQPAAMKPPSGPAYCPCCREKIDEPTSIGTHKQYIERYRREAVRWRE
jgi:hypothetical protein